MDHYLRDKKKLGEELLTEHARVICAELGIGLADWGFTPELRKAIEGHPRFDWNSLLLDVYDDMISYSREIGVQLDPKFDVLFELGM